MIFFLALILFLQNSPVAEPGEVFVGQDLREKDTLFQVSTMSALLAGAFDGEKTFEELKKTGDFGIGVIHALDGKMIALDGEFYQIKVLGRSFPVSDQMKTPFAAVTFFEEDEFVIIEDGPLRFARLKKSLDNLIADKTSVYAVRIDGEFAFAKTRSVPSQKRPYRRLNTVLRTGQKVREFENVEGTMVGFWYPRYVGGINIPGYHFHFITKDRTAGGHLLDCRLTKGVARIDRKTRIHIELLENRE
jgi:acetolactate decarboxylase